MNWDNLKLNKCPQCNKSIIGFYDVNLKMFICKCGFMITEKKFASIVSKKIEQDIDEKDEGGDFE